MKVFNNNVRNGTTVFAMLMAAMLAWAFTVASDAQATDSGSHSELAYVAHLYPMNSKVTGLPTSGEARFSIVGDKLTISVEAHGLQPNLVHWQHFHGFADNRAASCPSAAADMNGDGIIDLIETEPAAGTTMVPFTDDHGCRTWDLPEGFWRGRVHVSADCLAEGADCRVCQGIQRSDARSRPAGGLHPRRRGDPQASCVRGLARSDSGRRHVADCLRQS